MPIKFLSEKVKGTDRLAYMDVTVRTMLERILDRSSMSVDWILLTYNRDPCRVLMKTVLNLWVPKKAGNFLASRMTLLHGIH
jgi:hypothetical protein